MKNLFFTLFAIALAGVAAIAATTAMLNTPIHRIGPAPTDKSATGQTTPGTTPAPTTPSSGDRGARPDGIPDDDRAPAGKTAQPAEPAPAKPEAGKPDAPAGPDDEKADKDPYEGIAPEDLPPDLQYDADASVSFPTNT